MTTAIRPRSHSLRSLSHANNILRDSMARSELAQTITITGQRVTRLQGPAYFDAANACRWYPVSIDFDHLPPGNVHMNTVGSLLITPTTRV